MGWPVTAGVQARGWPPGPGVVTLRTNGRLLVVEHASGGRWQLGIGESALQPFSGHPDDLEPVSLQAVVELVVSQLVRVADIAQRAGVSPGTVASWRSRYRDGFPAQVAPGLWWWPDLVAAGFDRPRRPGRPPSRQPISAPDAIHDREGQP
jgi:Homeodomain-like domain